MGGRTGWGFILFAPGAFLALILAFVFTYAQVEEVVYLHSDVHDILSPEGFLRWVSDRLLPALAPPAAQLFPAVCSTINGSAMRAGR
jgi:hypothetical protein